jgi:hypothetical protein
MRIQLKTVLDCEPDVAWRALRSPAALREIYAPLMVMTPETELPTMWDATTTTVGLSFAGLIPSGRQRIEISFDDHRSPSSAAGATAMRWRPLRTTPGRRSTATGSTSGASRRPRCGSPSGRSGSGAPRDSPSSLPRGRTTPRSRRSTSPRAPDSPQACGDGTPSARLDPTANPSTGSLRRLNALHISHPTVRHLSRRGSTRGAIHTDRVGSLLNRAPRWISTVPHRSKRRTIVP